MSYVPNPTGFPDPDRSRLAVALAGSVLFHALVLGADRLVDLQARQTTAPPLPLQATLVPPQSAPVLLAPATPRAPATTVPKPKPLPPSTRSPTGFVASDAAALAARQIAQNLFYPPEAIARGLEGEAQVMLFLDASGNAITARLERSSGHAILDEAAIRAARAVRALPEGTPSEVLLPVRFRLR